MSDGVNKSNLNKNDIDILIPFINDELDILFEKMYLLNDTFPKLSFIKKNKNLYQVYSIYIENYKIDISNHDFNHIDFTCNTGYIIYPNIYELKFIHPNGYHDIKNNLLIPIQDYSLIDIKRFIKMYYRGFRLLDSEIINDIQNKIVLNKHNLSFHELKFISSILDFKINNLSPKNYNTIGIIGSDNFIVNDFFDIINEFLNEMAFIYTNTINGSIGQLINKLLEYNP